MINSATKYTTFFTDHGEYLGDHGLTEKWPSKISDSLVHESLITSGPGVPKGETIDTLTEMVDLGATLFDTSGLEPNYPIDGRSLLPLINKEVRKVRDFSVSEVGFLLSEEPIIEYATFPYDLKAQI